MAFSGANDSLDTCVSKALRNGKSDEAAFLTTSEVVRELEALEPHFDDVECVRALKTLVSNFANAHASAFRSSTTTSDLPSLDSVIASLGDEAVLSLEAEFAKTLELLHASRAPNENLKEGSNVLRFDGEGNDGYLWHHMSSTDLFDTELCKNSKEIDDALATVQQFMESCAQDSTGKQQPAAKPGGSGSRKSGSLTGKHTKEEMPTSAAVSSSFLSSLVLLLQNNPDLLVQVNNWQPLLFALSRVALETPGDAEKALSLYFDLAGPKQRFDLLQLLCRNVVKSSASSFVALVLKLVRKFPENWMSLTDDAIEALLLEILETVVLVHTEICSTEDPEAEWLMKWLSNLTLLYRLVQSEAFVKLIRKISDKTPSPHATACIILVVPRLAAHAAEDKASGAHKAVEYIFAKLLDAMMNSSLCTSIYNIAMSAVSLTVPFIAKAHKQVKLTDVLDALLAQERLDTQARRTASSLFIISHLAICSAPQEPSLLLSDEQCTRLDESFVTRLSRSNEETVITAFQDFLRLLLPLHWRRFPKTVEAIINTFAYETSGHKTAFSITQLVLISRSVEGWTHLHQQLQPNRLSASCFDALLDAILYVQKEEKYLSNKNELRPASFALLQRWCLMRDVYTGLVGVVTRRLESAYSRLSCPFLDERGKMWAVLFPLEMYCDFQKDGNPLENTPAQDHAYQHIAFLQTLRVFLWLLNPEFLYATCHPDFQDTFDKARSRSITLVLDELMTLYNLTDAEEQQGFVPPVTAAFGEDSLLYLLNLASLIVLLDPFAAHFLWRDPHALHQRRALRLFCQDRCGVDPVYFVLRFLTSSKGWKRLGPILVSGFQAELKVDVVISVSSFADGEAEPPAFTGTPVSEETVCTIARGAFPSLSQSETRSMASLIQCLLYVYSESENPTASLTELLKKRSYDDWLALGNRHARALAVAALLETNDELMSLLRREGIDCVYLSSLCVGNWLLSLFAHNARSACPFLSSVNLFANNGLSLWEESVAKQLTTFVLKTRSEMLKMEIEEDVVGERLIPLTYTMPIPSPLFALLVARPFTLGSPK